MARKKTVNNAFYEDLHGDWYGASDHPIALLRAENQVRNPWILQELQQHGASNVLDIGCGAGLLSNFLALKGYKVSGIDLSPSSLHQARLHDLNQSVHYVEAAAETLPFPDHTFDAVCAMDLLEHVNSPLAVIQEAARVLKPGGIFFFHTFNRTFLSYLLVIKGVEWLVPQVPKDMHLYRYFITPQELTAYCAQTGLIVTQTRGLVPKITLPILWRSIRKREIDPAFTFEFSPSLKTGYLGTALKP